MCFQKQRSLPNIPPLLGRLGLEVQYHAALTVPHNHSPEDTPETAPVSTSFDRTGLPFQVNLEVRRGDI